MDAVVALVAATDTTGEVGLGEFKDLCDNFQGQHPEDKGFEATLSGTPAAVGLGACGAAGVHWGEYLPHGQLGEETGMWTIHQFPSQAGPNMPGLQICQQRRHWANPV